MLTIDILCVGRIKEKYYTDALNEYIKRLSRYCRVHVVQVQDEATPDQASEALCQAVREKEGERLLQALRDDSFVIALVIGGKKFDSEGFAEYLGNLQVRGKSRITCVIGGSLGLSGRVIQSADLQMSFSDFTFPHQLMRVILAEQIYRAMRIMHHEPYHK